MANHPYNFYTNPGNLQDTDVWAFSRSPHTGSTTFKTTPLNFQTYLTNAGFISGTATNEATANTIVKRDGSANFKANNVLLQSLNIGVDTGVASGYLVIGNPSTSDIYFRIDNSGILNIPSQSIFVGNATFNAATFNNGVSFLGNVSFASGVSGIPMGGDLSGTNSSAVVSFVGGSTAASVHSAELLANAATSSNSTNTIVKRDSSGNFNASGANFSAGTTGFQIGGSNPSCNISDSGVSTGAGNFGFSSAGGQFFSSAVLGDVNLRNTDNTKNINIGVGNTLPQISISNTLITANVGISSAGTILGVNGNFSSGTVSGALVTGQLQSAAVGANRMTYTNGTNNLIGSANYTVNGTGGLTITGNFAAIGGNFAAGATTFNVTGTNAAVNIGPAGVVDFNLGRASSNGSFFNNSINGDACIRSASSANLRLGAGSISSQLDINTSVITAHVGINLPTTGGTASTLDYYEETTFTTSLTGAVTGSVTMTIRKIGKLIMIEIPTITISATSTDTIRTVTGLPSRFLNNSLSPVFISLPVLNNGVDAIGSGEIDSLSSGTFTWWGGAHGTNFTSGGLAKLYPHVFCYVI